MNVYAGNNDLRTTPEESAEMMAHMEKKFITDRTPDKLRERLLALSGTLTQAAADLETEDQTIGRWCNGKSRIPGVVWVALDALEAKDK